MEALSHNRVKNKKIIKLIVVWMSIFLILSPLHFFSIPENVKAEITEDEGFNEPTYQSIHKGDMYFYR